MLLYGLFGMQENMVLKNLLVNKFYHSFKKEILKQLSLKLKTKYQNEDYVYAFWLSSIYYIYIFI